MHTALQPLASILALDTRLLENCLAGLTDDTARQRPAGQANSAAFLFWFLLGIGSQLTIQPGGDLTTQTMSPFSGWMGPCRQVSCLSGSVSRDTATATNCKRSASRNCRGVMRLPGQKARYVA